MIRRNLSGEAEDIVLSSVTAKLQYLRNVEVPPVSYTPPPGKGESRREGNHQQFVVSIEDARPIEGELELDMNGFKLVPSTIRIENPADSDLIKSRVYPEVEKLVAAQTGAKKVVVFEHVVRLSRSDGTRPLAPPVNLVHNDYTESSAPARARQILPEQEAGELLKGRFAQFILWQPLRPVMAWPLALADARTIDNEDLAVAKLIFEDRSIEIYHGVFSATHRWRYFSRMQLDEAILFKCYDSARDGRARFGLHSAFDDPNSEADAPPRESIEIRSFAFF